MSETELLMKLNQRAQIIEELERQLSKAYAYIFDTLGPDGYAELRKLPDDYGQTVRI